MDAFDYRVYLRYLREYAGKNGCAVHAYCLMTNHVHLLLTPHAHDSCAGLMKQLGQCYVQTFNKAHKRSGTLWEGRFYSCLVPTEGYVLNCYRYIELNPVRAGMVSAPALYPWSSFSANAENRRNSFLRPHPALATVTDYRALVDTPVEPSIIEEIRKATRNGQRLGEARKRRGRSKIGTDPISSVPISS